MTWTQKLSIVYRWPFTSVALMLVISAFIPILFRFEVGYESGYGAFLMVLNYTIGLLFWVPTELLHSYIIPLGSPYYGLLSWGSGMLWSVLLDTVILLFRRGRKWNTENRLHS